MKVAIPASGNDNNAEVFEHFGRAPFYCIATIENNEIKSIEFLPNPAIESHAPGEIPSYLASRGVDTLICLGLGGRARYFFNELGINVITGVRGRIREVLEKYLRGEIKSVDYTPSRKWHDEH